MTKHLRIGIWLLSFLICSSTGFAKTPFEKSFNIKVNHITIGQVIVSFEDRISAGNISVDVETSLASPSGSFFPAGVSPFALPGIGAPVFITIKTTAGFRGPAKVTLHLEVLDYNPSLPLRLFVADGTFGGIFSDITAYQGPGSMYTSGYRDGFSEFVIAWDSRTTDEAIESKLRDLRDYLRSNRNLMDYDRYENLRNLSQDALQAYKKGNAAEAIEDLENFVNSCQAAISLNQMPSTFNDPLNPYPNVAGGLIMRAETAVFSLSLVQ